ncbi:F-box protein CPR30 [Abeliophyllum distichum]|uniref:F-box protein CPR30 n=1 Tax=Abeliophyllum distichum TaxID=126358 RepID=A0ABD1QHA7_9LAMI
MSHIPEYLVEDILSRLRVKSLMCFRSVSKSWHDLIDSPSFIKKHMKQSMKMKREESTAELVYRCNSYTYYSLQKLDLSGDPHPIGDPKELPPIFCHRYDYDTSSSYLGIYRIHLVGSCNGVICFVDIADHIVFWNLATRKFFEVQNYRIKLPEMCCRSSFVDYGFGYDSATDDYKVIRMITAHTDGITDSSLVELYSLKSDSWKRFEALVGHSFRNGYGILVGGALHWLRNKSYNTENREYMIVSFDLTKEEFNFLPHPELSGKFTWMNLGNYQDCLSLFCRADEAPDEAADSEIWVMKDLGIKESWTKVFNVNNTYTYMRAIYHSMCKTTNFWEKNRDTLEWNKEENKNIKNYCEVRCLPLEAEFVHCESLVGPSWTGEEEAFRL